MKSLPRIVLTLFLLIGCLGQYQGSAAQPLASLPPPIHANSLAYSSPFGPRHLSNKQGHHYYQFHFGVDYPYPMGTPIYAVQGGAIDEIHPDTGNNWVLPIVGRSSDLFPNTRFQYIHLFDNYYLNFNNSTWPTDFEGNRIYGAAVFNLNDNGIPVSLVTIELLAVGPTGPVNCFAIVFWSDWANDLAEKALSSCDGLKVGGVLTKNSVVQGELIAVVGESGAADGHPHLHLQVNGKDENELLYVQHDNSNPPDFLINFYKDKGDNAMDLDANAVQLGSGDTLDPTNDFPLRIKAKVDFSTTGHDLDEVQIIIYQEGTAQPVLTPLNKDGVICMLAGLCTEFNYGGTGVGRNISEFHCNDNTPQNPCDPLQKDVYGMYQGGGIVNFLTDPIDLTKLVPGNYVILARALNILGQVKETSVTVKVPPPPFTVLASCNGPFLSPSGSGYYDTITIKETLSYPIPQKFNLNQAPSFLSIPSDPDNPSNPLFPSLAFYTSVQRPSYITTQQQYMGYLSSVMAETLKPNPNWTNSAPGGAFKVILSNSQMTCTATISNEGYFPPYTCTVNSLLSPQDVINWSASVSFVNPAYCDSPGTANGVPICNHYSPLPLGNFTLSVPPLEIPNSTLPTPQPSSVSLSCP